MKQIFGLALAGIAMISSLELKAQSFAESALLFSRSKPGGSARIQAMGGAQISLGGDYSSSLSNPAGLGMYNRSEFAFTPSLNFSNTTSDYLGNTASGAKNNFSLPGFSLAFHKDKGEYGFLGGTFAATFNRINDFNRNLSYSGTSEGTSLIDFFISDASGYPDSQFDKNGDLYNTVTELGYDNYLISPGYNGDPNSYGTEISAAAKPFQKEDIQTSGKQNQWSFSYGANFNDKFFLGAGIGVTSITYKSTKKYYESFQNEPVSNFDLTENLQITGAGVNITAGGIYRVTDQVQLGASISSPTFYQLNDSYSATLNSHWKNYAFPTPDPDPTKPQVKNINNESANTDNVVSNYNLKTPTKLNAGATFFFNKKGFITADIEQLNYGRAKYSPITSGAYANNSNVSYASDNEQIKSLYKSTTNIRVGGEYRMKDFRFRAGYNLLSDPFVTKQNDVSRKIQTVSGGLGYRKPNFYIDLTVLYGFGDNSYRPYRVNTPTSPLVTFSQNKTNVMVTLGFPF
jgi:hypothetical protein